MKLLLFLVLLFRGATAEASDLSKIIIPGNAFGADWELTQPNLFGDAAAPGYINRKLPHQPMVFVNIIRFKTPEAARKQWDKKFSGPDVATFFKKVEGMVDAYDNILPPQMKDLPHLKRFLLFRSYWLTVEQVGDKDERKIFIEKYSEVIKKISLGQP